MRRRTFGQRVGRAIDAVGRFIALFDPRARPGTTYEIVVRHPDTGAQVRGYVGKTRQRPYWRRVDQHLERKPWAPDVVDHFPTWEGRCLNITLFLREVWKIVTGWPIYNYQWNRLNPRRIPIPRQYEIYGRTYYPGNGPTWSRARYGARRPHADRAQPGRTRTAGTRRR